MSCDELVRELERRVAAWRKQPSLSYEYSERVRCSELVRLIEKRFGRTYYIIATNEAPGDYRICSEPPVSTQESA